MKFLKSYLKSLSVFLLAWFSVLGVYAALSTVSSGDPLTATSWNEMVSKLTSLNTNNDDLVTKSYVDSQVSANSSWVEFAGYTTATYNANMWGIKGMMSNCNADYSWSTACTYSDILKLWSQYPWSENAWLIDWAYAAATSSSYYMLYTEDWNSSRYINQSYEPMCYWWRSPSTNSYAPFLSTTWRIELGWCTTNYKIPCCRG